jgi:hypothetical protein
LDELVQFVAGEVADHPEIEAGLSVPAADQAEAVAEKK